MLQHTYQNNDLLLAHLHIVQGGQYYFALWRLLSSLSVTLPYAT